VLKVSQFRVSQRDTAIAKKLRGLIDEQSKPLPLRVKTMTRCVSAKKKSVCLQRTR